MCSSDLAGDVTVIDVGVIDVTVADSVPNFTVEPVMNPVPDTSTVVPPTVGPVCTSSEVTTGATAV